MGQETDPNQKLMEAAENGNLEEACRLVEAGADVNFPADHGFRPLLMATYYAHVDVMRYLLAQGADANYAGYSEGTALMFAAGSGDVRLVSLLLEAGADANVALPRGGETALHVAAFRDQTEIVRLLIRAGADVNRRTNSDARTDMFDGGAKLWAETPLHFAAAYADPPTIEALLAAGADRAAPNAHGEPPIASAGRHRRPKEVLRLFK
jgi:ankyrin repeat protein